MIMRGSPGPTKFAFLYLTPDNKTFKMRFSHLKRFLVHMGNLLIVVLTPLILLPLPLVLQSQQVLYVHQYMVNITSFIRHERQTMQHHAHYKLCFYYVVMKIK